MARDLDPVQVHDRAGGELELHLHRDEALRVGDVDLSGEVEVAQPAFGVVVAELPGRRVVDEARARGHGAVVSNAPLLGFDPAGLVGDPGVEGV